MTMRLEPGPRDDDNTWSCCDHCLRCGHRHREPCPYCHPGEPVAVTPHAPADDGVLDDLADTVLDVARSLAVAALQQGNDFYVRSATAGALMVLGAHAWATAGRPGSPTMGDLVDDGTAILRARAATTGHRIHLDLADWEGS